MTRPMPASLVALGVCAAFLTGCALQPTFAKRTQVRPIPLSSAASEGAVRPSVYVAAVKAIDQRDYVRALDLLQIAREQTPNDVAVINAFGVVYDKLGRFDLSARYYSQAAELAPGSRLVAHNQAYSERLQGKWNADTRPELLASAEQPIKRAGSVTGAIAANRAADKVATPPLFHEPTKGAAVTVAAPPAGMVRATADGMLLMGRGLRIVDASGAPHRAHALRTRLVQKGWTAPRARTSESHIADATVILYPSPGAKIAKALARTLGGPIQMSDCGQTCRQVTLIIGKDRSAQPRGARS